VHPLGTGVTHGAPLQFADGRGAGGQPSAWLQGPPIVNEVASLLLASPPVAGALPRPVSPLRVEHAAARNPTLVAHCMSLFTQSSMKDCKSNHDTLGTRCKSGPVESE